MKKLLLIAAIMMATVMSVRADETKCNFTLYVESDVESDNLNEELTFDAWKMLAGINIKYKTSSHRSDNEQGIFYVGDEILISVYGQYYTFAGWSDGWTGGDPNYAWSRDITIAEVSERCGYSQVPNFTRAFQKFYGISPKEARAK